MEKFITKHTPGKWSISPIASDDWRDKRMTEKTEKLDAFEYQSAWIKDSDGNILAEVKAIAGTGFLKPSEGQFEANAYLIAAAPLLLSALIKAVEEEDRTYKSFWLHQGDRKSESYQWPEWYHEAKTAIAAAGVVVEERKRENSES